MSGVDGPCDPTSHLAEGAVGECTGATTATSARASVKVRMCHFARAPGVPKVGDPGVTMRVLPFARCLGSNRQFG